MFLFWFFASRGQSFDYLTQSIDIYHSVSFFHTSITHNNLVMDLNNRIARAAFETFATIPKSGKPISGKEWTVMTAIAKITKQCESIEIVALGTGE